MLTHAELEKYEKRARSALNGYTSDVNITCYVYGKDVLDLLEYIKVLQEKVRGVVEELRPCVTDNGYMGSERTVVYEALGAVAVKKVCKLLNVEADSKG